MTRSIPTGAFIVVIAAVLSAQAPQPPLSDARLTVHTLLREDVFAGFLQNDLARLSRAEKNIDLLLASRPRERAPLLAWQAMAALTRAAQASEARQLDQFTQHYNRAHDLFAEAMRVGPDDPGVFATTGGANLMLADRLPTAERAAAWEQAYAAYQRLFKMQEPFVDKLPLHLKGELLAGVAQTAQRTGREAEASAQLDRIQTLLADTPYAKRAQQWKDVPASRAQTRIACQTCHAPGTLASRLAEVSK